MALRARRHLASLLRQQFICGPAANHQHALTRGYVPIVIEQTRGGGERAYDIFSRLLKERIVVLNGAINDHTSEASLGGSGCAWALPCMRKRHNVLVAILCPMQALTCMTRVLCVHASMHAFANSLVQATA